MRDPKVQSSACRSLGMKMVTPASSGMGYGRSQAVGPGEIGIWVRESGLTQISEGARATRATGATGIDSCVADTGSALSSE